MPPREVPPSHSPIRAIDRFWSDERSRRRFVDRMFDDGARDYEHVERLLALGSGPWYRRDALRRAGLGPGMRVLDIATGTGLAAREAATLCAPGGFVIGLDPSAGMLHESSTRPGALLVRGFGERLPFADASFDFVCMGFALRHVADLGALLREIRRVLAPGGRTCILEITRPKSGLANGALRTFMTGLIPAFAGGSARRARARELMDFYWETIDACVSPETVLREFAAAGFAGTARTVTLGIFSEYVARQAAPIASAPRSGSHPKP